MKLIISVLVLAVVLVLSMHHKPKCVDPNANSSTINCNLVQEQN